MFNLREQKFLLVDMSTDWNRCYHSFAKENEIFCTSFNSETGRTFDEAFDKSIELDFEWFALPFDFLLVGYTKRSECKDLLHIIKVRDRKITALLFIESLPGVKEGVYTRHGKDVKLSVPKEFDSVYWRHFAEHSFDMIKSALKRNEDCYEFSYGKFLPIGYLRHHFDSLREKATEEVSNKMVIPEIMLVGAEKNGNFFGMYKDYYTKEGTFKKIQHIVEEDKRSKITDSVVEVPKGWMGINDRDIFYSPGFSWGDPGENAHILLFVYPIGENPKILIIDSLHDAVGKEFQQYKGFHCMIDGQVLKIDTPEFLNIKEIDIGIKEHTGDIVKYCSDRDYRYSNDQLFLRRMLDIYNKLFPNIAKKFKYG